MIVCFWPSIIIGMSNEEEKKTRNRGRSDDKLSWNSPVYKQPSKVLLSLDSISLDMGCLLVS